jgi:hypothetical protein
MAHEKPELPQLVKRVRIKIGFFGQINPYKGVHTVLKALALLSSEERRGVFARQSESTSDFAR